MTCPCNSVPCVCPPINVCPKCGGVEGMHTLRSCANPPKDFAEPVAAVGPLPTTGLASAESPRCPAVAPSRDQALEEALREIRRRIDFSPPAARDWSVHRTTILDVDDIAFRALHNESGNGHVLSPSPVPQTGTQQLELEADHAAGDELAIGREVDDVHADPIAGDPTTRKRKSSNSPAAAPLRPAREVATEVVMPRVNGHPDGVDALTPALIDLCERAILADRTARPEVAEVERLRKTAEAAIVGEIARLRGDLEAQRQGGNERGESIIYARLRTAEDVLGLVSSALATDRRGEP